MPQTLPRRTPSYAGLRIKFYALYKILLGHKLIPQDFGHNQFLDYTWLRGLEIHRS